MASKKISGYKGIQLFRRPIEKNEVEFITVMLFDSVDVVKQFAGEDYERAYVPPKARELLVRFDEHSKHYEVKNGSTISKSIGFSTVDPRTASTSDSVL